MILTKNALAKMGGMIVVVGLVSCALVADAYVIESIETATSKDFVVGPGKIEMTIEPGQSKTAEIRVSNRLGTPHTFRVEIEDFTGSRNPQETVLLLGNERGPYTLKDYISVPEMTFTLESGQRAVIPVTVSIPTDAEAGGKYGSVLISTLADRTTGENSGAAVVSRIGTLFFVTVPGEERREGELREFSATEGAYADHGPIHFRLLYENKGSMHLNPYGEIRVRNILGKEVGAVYLEPWFALPDSLRLREVTWDSPFLFGKYTATASINRGYDNVIDTLEYSFWVIPWKIVLAFFAIVVIFVLIVRFAFTRFEIRRK